MVKARWLLLTLGAAGLVSVPASAQSAQRWSVQASGLYEKLFGTAFDGIDPGPGAEAQIRYTPGALSIGVGGQFTHHTFSIDPGVPDATANIIGIFVEPRFVIATSSERFAPYIAGRFALTRVNVNLDVNTASLTGHANGFTANGGGGILVSLSRRVNLDIGATYGYTKFKDLDLTLTDNSTNPPNRSESSQPLGDGQNLIVRLGLAVGLGG